MRVALAQINPTVGDVDGNAAKVAEWIGRARERGRRAGDPPRALHPRLPGRGPLPEAPLPRAPTSARSRSWPAAVAGDHRPGRLRRAGRRPGRRPPRPQLDRGPRRRRGSRPSTARTACPTTPSSTSSATSSPAPSRSRSRSAALGVGLTICEDVWLPGPPGAGRGRGGRAADRQPLRLPLPPRQGPRAGSDVRRALARLRRLLRLLQPGRRPGRARLRRPEPRHRPRRQRHRPRRPVRGGAAGLRDPRTPSRARWPSRSPTSTRSTRR